MAELTDRVLDEAELRMAVDAPECGAVVSFAGVVRNHNEGKAVLRIEYEAAAELALPLLEKIERDALERFSLHALRIAHRTGMLEVGEASVVIACSAAHRAEAFEACRWAIDTLKHSVPIWKKEHFADGTAEWVQGCKMHG